MTTNKKKNNKRKDGKAANTNCKNVLFDAELTKQYDEALILLGGFVDACKKKGVHPIAMTKAVAFFASSCIDVMESMGYKYE